MVIKQCKILTERAILKLFCHYKNNSVSNWPSFLCAQCLFFDIFANFSSSIIIILSAHRHLLNTRRHSRSFSIVLFCTHFLSCPTPDGSDSVIFLIGCLWFDNKTYGWFYGWHRWFALHHINSPSTPFPGSFFSTRALSETKDPGNELGNSYKFRQESKFPKAHHSNLS